MPHWVNLGHVTVLAAIQVQLYGIDLKAVKGQLSSQPIGCPGTEKTMTFVVCVCGGGVGESLAH